MRKEYTHRCCCVVQLVLIRKHLLPFSLCISAKQCCDLGYHASLNRALRTYLSAEYNLETSRHEGLDIIENAVDSLDPRSDRQRFMEMYPTAFCPPVKFEFQPHMGDEVRNTAFVSLQHITEFYSLLLLWEIYCEVSDG